MPSTLAISRYSVGAWQSTSGASSSRRRNRSSGSKPPSCRITADPQLHGPSSTFQIDFAQPVPAVHHTTSPGRASSQRSACARFAHV